MFNENKRDKKKCEQIVEIIEKELPEFFSSFRDDKESFLDHIINDEYVEWSNRGADLRFIFNYKDDSKGKTVMTGHIYFIAGKGWGGDLNQDKLDKINQIILNTVGDVR